jgi:hypothetical protein
MKSVCRKPSSRMLHLVALVRTAVSEELSASIITSLPDDGGAKFLRNLASYKIHTAQHPRRRHSS